MPVTSHTQNAFTNGEWSPRLLGRADQEQYFSAVQEMRNFIVQPHGGAERRTGTRFIQKAKELSQEVRLVPFEAAAGQSYVLEFGPKYVRMYRDNGALLDPDTGNQVEVATPYQAEELEDLKFTQSADVLFMAHSNHRPRELRRNGDTDWEIVLFEFEDGPYNRVNTNNRHRVRSGNNTGPEHAISAVDTTNNVVTISGDQSDDVRAGDKVEIRGSTGNDGEYTVDSVNVTGIPDTEVTLVESITDSTADGNLRLPATLFASRDTWDQADADSNRLVRAKGSGGNWRWAKIVEFNNAQEVRALIRSDVFPTDGRIDWRLGAWSDGNWPEVVMFHRDRLWFGATSEEPQSIWSSEVASFNSFSPTNLDGSVSDDNGLDFTVNDDQVNVIRWMRSLAKGLIIGTDTAEFVATGGGVDEAVTPTNILVKRQTRHGSSQTARSAVAGSRVLFATRDGRRVRAVQFNLESDQFEAMDLTLRAEHIFAGTEIRDMDWAESPASNMWVVTSDGRIMSLTYNPNQKVVAWADHPIGGKDDGDKVRSIAIVEDQNRSQVWMLIRRKLGGSFENFVELLEAPFGHTTVREKAFFVDSGLTHDGAEVDTVTGLDHLEGRTVKVLADGAVRPDKTVSGGSISLDSKASVISVGLGYTSRIKTMPIEPRVLVRGDPRAQFKATFRIFAHVFRSMGGKMGTEDELDPIIFRKGSDPMDEPPPLVTGLKDIMAPGGYERLLSAIVESDDPVPLNVLSLTIALDVGGR